MKKTGIILALLVLVALIMFSLVQRPSKEEVLRKKHRIELARQQTITFITPKTQENTDTGSAVSDTQKLPDPVIAMSVNTSASYAPSSIQHTIIGVIIILVMLGVIILLVAKMKKKYWADILLFKAPSKVGVEGSIGYCKWCGIPIFGEETVIEMQKKAVYVDRSAVRAQLAEKQSGYRCSACGREFCKDCLEKYAPSSSNGGKLCPSCMGSFQIIHG